MIVEMDSVHKSYFDGEEGVKRDVLKDVER